MKVCANPRCKATIIREGEDTPRIDKGTDLPGGPAHRDMTFCCLRCVWERYPHEPVKHGV